MPVFLRKPPIRESFLWFDFTDPDLAISRPEALEPARGSAFASGDPVPGLMRVFSNRGEWLGDGVGLAVCMVGGITVAGL